MQTKQTIIVCKIFVEKYIDKNIQFEECKSKFLNSRVGVTSLKIAK